MTDLRTAAQQALEFLDEQFGWSPGEAPRIDALRAALAEDALERMSEDERRLGIQMQPVQEPVAWRITDGEGDWEYRTDLPEDWSIQWSARYGRKYEPLYTVPPQRKPLTQEEIIDATEHIDTSRDGYFIDIARAIERAHNIK